MGKIKISTLKFFGVNLRPKFQRRILGTKISTQDFGNKFCWNETSFFSENAGKMNFFEVADETFFWNLFFHHKLAFGALLGGGGARRSAQAPKKVGRPYS